MSALPTPKLADLDDPLAPRREPPPSPTQEATRPATPRRRAAAKRPTQKTPATDTAAPSVPKQSLADEQLVAVFARMPESLSERLAEGVRALNAGRPRRGRVSQQDILGALVDHYVTPTQPAALNKLVDAYRQRVRP
jgi:hypothetical protein